MGRPTLCSYAKIQCADAHADFTAAGILQHPVIHSPTLSRVCHVGHIVDVFRREVRFRNTNDRKFYGCFAGVNKLINPFLIRKGMFLEIGRIGAEKFLRMFFCEFIQA